MGEEEKEEEMGGRRKMAKCRFILSHISAY